MRKDFGLRTNIDFMVNFDSYIENELVVNRIVILYQLSRLNLEIKYSILFQLVKKKKNSHLFIYFFVSIY